MEKIIDLQALMVSLDKETAHPKLSRSLKKLLRVQSCNSDVRQAGFCVEQLVRLLASPKPEPIVLQALLMSAVIFYVRATVGSSQRGGRGSSQITSDLAPPLRAAHQAVTDIRNEAIAHVHIGDTVDAWHQQFLALVESDRGWRVMCTSRGVYKHPDLVAKLEQLVPEAQALLEARFHAAVAHSAGLFNAAAATIDAAPFLVDAARYFGNPELAKQMLATGTPGSSTSIFYH